MDEEKQLTLALDTALMAGKILAENGAEIYRVEDIMARIAANAGFADTNCYATMTGIFISIKHSPYTMIETVRSRKIDLEKVVIANDLSRLFARKEITLDQLHTRLEKVDSDTADFPFWLKALGAAIISGTLSQIYAAPLSDILPAALIGGAAYIAAQMIGRLIPVHFLGEFVAACLIGLLALAAVNLGLGTSVDGITIGGVMPLVPGVAITNSFRDILAGNLVAGSARATEAIFTAGAIGVGIAIVFKIFL